MITKNGSRCKLHWERVIWGGLQGNLMEYYTGGSVVKNPPVKAGDSGNADSTSGQGRSPEEGMATHSTIFAWKTPWPEEPGGLQSMGL